MILYCVGYNLISKRVDPWNILIIIHNHNEFQKYILMLIFFNTGMFAAMVVT